MAQTALLGSDISMEHFSLRQGLVNSVVTSIVKDAQGFLWIGTQNGISRFDGYKFVSFYPQADTPYDIRTSLVSFMCATASNELLLFSNSDKSTHEVFNTLTGNNLMLQNSSAFDYNFKDANSLSGKAYLLATNNGRDSIFRYEGGGHYTAVIPAANAKHLGLDEHLKLIPESDGTFWVSYISQESLVISHFDGKGKTIGSYSFEDFTPRPMVPVSLHKPIGVDFLKTKNGQVFASIKGQGVYALDKKDNRFKLLPLPQKAFFNLAQDTLGNVLAYDEGIEAGKKTAWLIKPSIQIEDYSAVTENLDKLNVVYSDDLTSWLVIGGNDGLRKVWLKTKLFTNYIQENLSGVPGSNSMRGIGKSPDGNIIFATEMSGVYALTPKHEIIRPGNTAPVLEIFNRLYYCRTVLPVGDSLVLIGNTGGFVGWFPMKKRMDDYFHPNVRSMALAKNGIVWISSFKNELYSFDPGSKLIHKYLNKDGANPLQGLNGEFVYFDKKGNLWVGVDKGLVRINVKEKTSVLYDISRRGVSYPVVCIAQAGDDMLWLGTLNGGLQCFNPATGKVTAVFKQKDGLCNDNIASIVADNNNDLWLGTYNGLAWFNRSSNAFVNFYDTDGLPSNEFNRHSFFKDPQSDMLYFGGMGGITAFHQHEVIRQALATPVLISSASYTAPNGKARIDNLLGLADGAVIELPAISRGLNLQLSLANYENPASNQFSYKVEGLDNDWHYLGSDHNINFTYLPSGEYTLRLRGTTSRRGWPAKEYSVGLVVHEFWYNLLWVRILLGVALAISAFAYYRFLLKRRLAMQETQRLAELDTFKTRFFTNITHEFRTPLTIILGAAGQITEGFAASNTGTLQRFSKHVGLIKRSGENLLRLINQILDLSKLENSSLPIRNINGDIVAYVRYIADSLHAIAEAYNITITVQSNKPVIFIDYDPERLQQIVHNLVSNALKFTQAGGAVNITVDHDTINRKLVIVVADNGVGIPKSDLPKIFERFYQAKNQLAANAGGTGIGLSFIKELLKVMGGTITVASTEGEGTVFTVTMPVSSNTGLPLHQLQQGVSYLYENKVNGGEESLPLLLIIEDNPDVVELLANSLRGLYRVEFAYNGKTGIEKALELTPDIVISDVMMPLKDGFEVLETLKNDIRTSHIPIVMLTARVMVEDRIAGLKKGADAYLAKPFHHGELMATLSSLLETREKLRARYANYTKTETFAVPEPLVEEIKPDDEAVSTALPVQNIWQDGVLQLEDEFIQQLYTYISERLDDASLSVEQVSQAMGMSQSVLYRKLTALTGHSLVPFIRTIRLQKAKTLLLNTAKPISEVAYETGFSDAKFFSNVFLQEFGMRPKAFRSSASVN